MHHDFLGVNNYGIRNVREDLSNTWNHIEKTIFSATH
jgi:hypothetical protein